MEIDGAELELELNVPVDSEGRMLLLDGRRIKPLPGMTVTDNEGSPAFRIIAVEKIDANNVRIRTVQQGQVIDPTAN